MFRCLLPDPLLRRISCRLREDRVPLLASLLTGLAAYGYAYTHKLVSHDDIFYLFSKGEGVGQGRWGLQAISWILPDISMPWLWGLVSLLILCAAAAIIVRVSGVQDKVLKVVLAAVCVTSPAIIGLYAYMFMSCTWSLALLLSVAAVPLWFSRKAWSKAAALILLAFSLSLYQGFVTTTAVLLLADLCRRCLEGDPPGAVFRQALWDLLLLLGGVLLYALATGLVLLLSGTALNSYTTGAMSFGAAELVGRIRNAYYQFYLETVQGANGLVLTKPTRMINLLGLLLGFAGVVRFFLSRKPLGSKLLLVLILLLVPTAINGMYLAAQESAIHTLVLYSYTGLYVILAILSQDLLSGELLPSLSRWAALGIACCMLLITGRNLVISNESYLYMELAQQGQASFYTALLNRVQTSEGYRSDIPVALLGNASGNFASADDWGEITRISGIDGLRRYDDYCREAFITRYLGVPVLWADDLTKSLALISDEFEAMPLYPAEGSVRIIDGTMVVKFSHATFSPEDKAAVRQAAGLE